MSRLVLTSEKELNELREGRTPQNTRQSTQYAVNLYQKWREEHAKRGHRYAPLDCGVPEILNFLIPMFIVEIRKKDGTTYHPESVRSIYFGINRYLVEQDATMNLTVAPEFLTCRQKVDRYIKKLQSELATPQKKQAPAIPVVDQQEMWESGLLGPATPQSLVDAVIWSCGRYFALRGKEELRGAKYRNFTFENVEVEGEMRSRVTFTENRSKANQGGLFKKIDPRPVVHIEDFNEENSFTKLFNLYMAKLPQNADLTKALFFTPKKLDNPINTAVWFTQTPIGVNTLCKTVKRLFGEVHSNHSMRVSTVNDLHAAGVSETDIIKKTRHRTVTTLASYRRDNLATTSRISDALSAPSRVSTGDKRKQTVEGQEVKTSNAKGEVSEAKKVKQEADLNETLLWLKDMKPDDIAELSDVGEEKKEEKSDEGPQSVGTNTNVILPRDLSVSTRAVRNTSGMNISAGLTITNNTDKNVATELSFHAEAEVFFTISA